MRISIDTVGVELTKMENPPSKVPQLIFNEVNVNESAKGRANPVQSQHKKQPYQKPVFRHETVFETSALVCGKINASTAQCRSNRKKS